MSSERKSDQQFDLIVIGSGSAGSSAAAQARAQGHSVAIVEKDKVGGDCPNYACVPSKALLRSAKVYSLLKGAGEFGLRANTVDFDWTQVMARKERAVGQTGAATAEDRYQREGIALFRGVASFEDEHRLRVAGRVLRGVRFLIATGSRPEVPRIAEAKPITSVRGTAGTGAPRAGLPRRPARIVVAVPVGAPETCAEFQDEADESVCARMPDPFYGVGLWYGDFSQTTDEEIHDLLQQAGRAAPAYGQA